MRLGAALGVFEGFGWSCPAFRRDLAYLKRMVSLLALAVMAETRSFRMGFTPWPPELSAAGMAQASQFMQKNGDLSAIMFLGGIPWQEALDGRPFSQHLQQQLAQLPPPGTKVFLSISPLSMTRNELAPYYGETDNLPLPPEWRGLAFDDPKVVASLTRFTLRCIKKLKPESLAIGVESNALLTTSKEKWPAYKRMHAQVYRAVKAKHPRLPVFFTTEVNHYLGRSTGASAADQAREVADLMKSSDWFAMSCYPHMSLDTPWPIPAEFFGFAKAFRKPIAVSETGMNSRPVVLPQFTLVGSPEKQDQYYQVLLDAAKRDRYRLVVTFCTTDYERLLPSLPAELRDLASIWTYSGLQTSSSVLKPAGMRWQQAFALPYRR